MLKVAVVILADTDSHEALGRSVNALEGVKEFKDITAGICAYCTTVFGTDDYEEHPSFRQKQMAIK